MEILIPKQKRETVEETLQDEGLDFTLVEEKSREEPSVVITFPLPAPAVESALDDLLTPRAEPGDATGERPLLGSSS
ncbi:hypothetical protein [Haloterrigena alkaliphila]|uniref:hypothetical protein n=1 Tax=Haloterrigena alkaliphila TaxID=2816475 RepID=UPI001CFFD336|nr:hypothetical protein [Haloterrigena alkaliphila]UHQ95037.1 hypothetical protein J0X25_04220 [Haloterrigena alkaliphila]